MYGRFAKSRCTACAGNGCEFCHETGIIVYTPVSWEEQMRHMLLRFSRMKSGLPLDLIAYERQSLGQIVEHM